MISGTGWCGKAVLDTNLAKVYNNEKQRREVDLVEAGGLGKATTYGKQSDN